jgi:hypothetical protein
MVQRSKQVLFVLLSVADLALTCWLLERSGGHVQEANPVAAWWLAQHSALGLACFKGAAVLVVLGLAALIARHRPRAAGHILTFGCTALALVVLYSVSLCPAATLSPEEREAIETWEASRQLDETNRATHEWRLRLNAFQALRVELCQGLLAGSLTLREAVDRLLASEKARERNWLSSLSRFYLEGSVAQRIAAYLLWHAVLAQEDKPVAAWSVALRLEQEFQCTYDRSPPRAHRDLLLDPGAEDSIDPMVKPTPAY